MDGVTGLGLSKPDIRMTLAAIRGLISVTTTDLVIIASKAFHAGQGWARDSSQEITTACETTRARGIPVLGTQGGSRISITHAATVNGTLVVSVRGVTCISSNVVLADTQLCVETVKAFIGSP